jgi:ParB/Sulfiredoxin domain
LKVLAAGLSLPVTLPETIVRRRCAALILYARYARTHSDQQVAQIAASIREFGFTNPVLIDQDDGIIAGHGRVLAAHLLGLDEVPCIVLAHLSPTQRRAYVIADNKLALNAGWDLEMLSLEIGEIGEAGLTSTSPVLMSSNSASYSPRGPKVTQIPTMRRSLPRTRYRSRATYGYSAGIDCCAATAQWRRTSSACSAASSRT